MYCKWFTFTGNSVPIFVSLCPFLVKTHKMANTNKMVEKNSPKKRTDFNALIITDVDM